jgi:fido (protein-threonine AMPylation protein)
MKFDGDKPYTEDKNKLPYQTKLDLWETGFGLQAIDGLRPSKYMVELAQENIEGKKSYTEVYHDIKKYYDEETTEHSTKEADIVSLRVAELLSDNHFLLSPATLLGIHRHLFTDVFDDPTIPVGEFRSINMTKSEDVLIGDSVQYASHFMIRDTLNYDFEDEKNVQYSDKTKQEQSSQVEKFISGIWQIHPFREGNTRTTAVFTIQYLRSLGFAIDNEPFKKNASFFRNALVLDNANGELKTRNYLDMFFENALFNGKNILSEEDMMKRTKQILG